jgi:selenide,water dikinase
MTDDSSGGLLSLAETAGSAATFGPADLATAQALLPERFNPERNPGLLTASRDGAAVYRLNDSTVLVQALALITPASDDAYTYGAIAAANAMNGVFARGADVALALNLAGFPEALPPEVLTAVFRGGADKVAEAGGVIAGGHTVLDAVPKYGLSVTGLASPEELLSPSGARPGDVVVLAKALGTGVVLGALRAGVAGASHVETATASMLRLTREAAGVAHAAGASAVAEVAGYGLFGAALAIADASGVLLALRAGDLPVLPGALQYAGMDLDATAANRNLDQFADHAIIEEELPGAIVRLAFEPQTSGGLLMTIALAQAGTLVQGLRHAGYVVAVIGSVHRGSDVSLDP